MEGVKTIITLLCDLFAFFWFALRQQAALASENLLLRKQLVMFQKRNTSHYGLTHRSELPSPKPLPQYVIGRSQPGNHTNFVDQQHFDLRSAPASTDLWERPAAEW